jgi:hypothetical protein
LLFAFIYFHLLIISSSSSFYRSANKRDPLEHCIQARGEDEFYDFERTREERREEEDVLWRLSLGRHSLVSPIFAESRAKRERERERQD